MKRAFFSGALFTALVGCGGIAVIDDAGSGGDGAGTTVGTTRAATSSTRATTVGPSTVQNSAVVGTPIDPDIEPRIERVELFADCQPEIGLDPLEGTIEVSYANVGSSGGTITIVDAQVEYAMVGRLFPINLQPATSSFVEAGQQSFVLHQKVATPGDSSAVCNFCGLEATVHLTYDNGRKASLAGPFFCGF